jgi:hypothetical protein
MYGNGRLDENVSSMMLNMKNDDIQRHDHNHYKVDEEVCRALHDNIL